MLGPRSMEPMQHLQRHRSTKLLIDRYESMGSTLSPSPFRSAKPSSSGLVPKRTSPSNRKNDKSPIRQSLRNLFSVFKKVNVTGNHKPDENTSSISRPGLLPILTSSSVLDFEPPPPVRKHSGSLLYLSHTSDKSQLSSSSPILPVWSACAATVETNAIVISWITTNGSPSTHIIRLSNCTDVRSLSSLQLDAEECVLLPKGNTKELKVFEVLFEGRARERFAASSVRERAEWVSAIW